MAAVRTENLADNVISLAERQAKKLSPVVPDQVSSGTKEYAEIYNVFRSLNASLSPTVPTPKTKDTRVPKTRLPHDEQHSLEEIAILVPRLSDKELKARFPKAWNEHQTIRRKTSRKSSRDKLHPGFAKFRDFLIAMGPAPGPSFTVDRKDPSNPVYGPRECRWADKKAQARNRSTNVNLTWMGERRTLAEWADLSGIPYETLKKRHQRGKPVEEIFADAKRYRTPAEASIPKSAPVATGCTDVAFDGDGWPVALNEARDFETGWTHARAAAIKVGGTPLSKAYFGAWVAGSQLRASQRQMTDAGFIDLIYGRDKLTPDRRAYLSKLAAEQGIDVARYDRLLSVNNAFVAAHLDDVERWAMRSPYAPHPIAARASAFNSLSHDIKTRPQYKPLDVWTIFIRKN